MPTSMPLPIVSSQQEPQPELQQPQKQPQQTQQQQPQLKSLSTTKRMSSSSTSPSSSSSQAPSSSSSSTTSIVPSIIAGYASGICAVVVGHPMDSAKVWLQTNTNLHNVIASSSGASTSSSRTSATSAATAAARGAVASVASSSSSSSSVANMSTLAAPPPTTTSSKAIIPNWRTLRALYAGVTGPLLTVGVVQSLNFAIYETARRELFHLQQQYMSWQTTTTTNTTTTMFDRNRDSLTNVALAGATSGVFLSVVTAPILLVKTTSQIQGIGFRQSLLQVVLGNSNKHPTPSTTTTTTSVTLLPSWYRVGFGIHSCIEILSRSVYYATYEGCKRYLRSHREEQQQGLSSMISVPSSSDGNTLSERMISAAAAGISCWAVIFPLDSIRSRIYAQMALTTITPPTTTTTSASGGTPPPRPVVAWDMAKTMYQQGFNNGSNSNSSMYRRRLQGLRPFFRGFGVTVLRAGPVAAAALPVYDYVLEQVSTQYY